MNLPISAVGIRADGRGGGLSRRTPDELNSRLTRAHSSGAWYNLDSKRHIFFAVFGFVSLSENRTDREKSLLSTREEISEPALWDRL